MYIEFLACRYFNEITADIDNDTTLLLYSTFQMVAGSAQIGVWV
jgi:hypothetical protein